MTLVEMQPPVVTPLPALLAMSHAALKDHLDAVQAQGDVARLCMQLFYVYLLSNQQQAAVDMQAQALRLQRVYRIAGSQRGQLRLLVVMGPGHMQHNTPIEFVLHGSAIQTDILYLLPDEDVPTILPAHDVTFIAIGESTQGNALLGKLNAVMDRWPTPVINRPGAIPNCARDTSYQRLVNIPGLFMPQTQRVRRGDELAMDFPLTLRPVDTQGGVGLQRIDRADALEAYYAAFPAAFYYAAQYVDYRSAEDGLYRKLRVVLIDGRPYLCHVAIASHWMVHYRSADMARSPEKRGEEQRAMEYFDQDFAVRFKAPLAAIAQALQLDYVTVDCAQSPDGRLLVFEVDSRGLVHAADPTDLYPYKPATMQKAFDAFYALLRQRVGT